MIIPYEHAMSPYVQKVKIALREKGLPFEVCVPEELGSGAASDEFVIDSPRAEVPALIDADTRIFDSTIIRDYIDDKWPDRPLLPAEPAARARARMIEEVCDTQFEAILWGILEIEQFHRATGELADQLRSVARVQLAGIFCWLERHLGDAAWYGGLRFDRADLSVAPFLAMAERFGEGPAPDSSIGRWLARARERASVGTSLEEGVVAAVALRNSPRHGGGAKFRREYRDHRLEWIIKSGGIDVVLRGLEQDNIRFTAYFQ